MNVDELWRRLGRTDKFPAEAIIESLEHWDEVSDRYLSKLRAKASGAKLSDEDLPALFVAVHMFAEKRDDRAYMPLCADLARDPDPEGWLGDGLFEDVDKILINLYDGDPTPLRDLAVNTKLDTVIRQAALKALSYLVRSKSALGDDDMRTFLIDFGRGLRPGEDAELGAFWAFSIAALGYGDLGPEVARAISRNVVDSGVYDLKYFHEDIAKSRRDPLLAFHEDSVRPFGTTLDTLSKWNWGDDARASDAGRPAYDPYMAVAPPHINPNRDVGRNDPCPCGSGKKYKKCCLAA